MSSRASPALSSMIRTRMACVSAFSIGICHWSQKYPDRASVPSKSLRLADRGAQTALVQLRNAVGQGAVPPIYEQVGQSGNPVLLHGGRGPLAQPYFSQNDVGVLLHE